MAKTSLRRMRTFIEMYNMQDTLTVRKCSGDEPADRYELGQVVAKGYQVDHKVGKDDYIYLCKTLTAAGECVTKLVFNLPMDDDVTPCE
jgi:hypothetical protein